MNKKYELYKTCKYEGQYASILAWYKDGSGYTYKIKTLDDKIHLVYYSECSEYCL